MRKELLRRIKGLTVLLLTMILLWTTFGMDVLAAETGYVLVVEYCSDITDLNRRNKYAIYSGDAAKFDNINLPQYLSYYDVIKNSVEAAGFTKVKEPYKGAEAETLTVSEGNLSGNVYVIQNSGGVKYYENGIAYSSSGSDSGYHKIFSNVKKIELTPIGTLSTTSPAYRVDITTTIPVTAITVKSEGDVSEIKIGSELQLSAVKTPEDAEDPEIEWSSGDESIAKVDNTGKVTGISAGTVTITAKVKDSSPEITDTFQLTVLADPAEDVGFHSGLKIKQTNGKIKVSWDKCQSAAKFEVYATYCGSDFPKKATKTTTNNSITIKKLKGKKLDLTKNFKLYVVAYDSSGNNIGKTVVSHFAGKNNKIYKNPKEVKLATKALTLNKGQSSKISASVKMEAGKKKALGDNHAAKLRYQSTNQNIATVDSKGNVTAVGSGECKIYVFARNGLAKAVSITVNK